MEKSSDISIRNFLHIVFKRKIQILLFFGLSVCAVTAFSLYVKPTYEASAQILIKVGRENLYIPTLPTNNQLSPIINPNQEELINSEVAILTSRFLAEKVIEFLGPTSIYPDLNSTRHGLLSRLFASVNSSRTDLKGIIEHDAIGRFQKNVTVERIEKANVIKVSFKHEDPSIAAKVINTLINSYLERHLQVYQDPQSTRFFQNQSQALKNKLKRAEANLKTFREQYALNSPQKERNLLLHQEAELRTELNQALIQEAEIESRISQLRRQLATTPKTIALDQEIDYNPGALSSLQAKLIEMEAKEQELLGKYNDQNLLVQNIRTEIQMVRKKLAEQETKGYLKSRSGVNPIYQSLLNNILHSEAELNALRAKKKTQIAHLVDYRERFKRLNQLETEFNSIQQQLEIDRQNYRLYLTKFSILKFLVLDRWHEAG
jgi:polysaccharide biosynthesis protein PslE